MSVKVGSIVRSKKLYLGDSNLTYMKEKFSGYGLVITMIFTDRAENSDPYDLVLDCEVLLPSGEVIEIFENHLIVVSDYEEN